MANEWASVAAVGQTVEALASAWTWAVAQMAALANESTWAAAGKRKRRSSLANASTAEPEPWVNGSYSSAAVGQRRLE